MRVALAWWREQKLVLYESLGLDGVTCLLPISFMDSCSASDCGAITPRLLSADSTLVMFHDSFDGKGNET